MSPKLFYEVVLTNVFTGDHTTFISQGPARAVADKINMHYGLELVSANIVATIVSRPELKPNRLKGITIIPKQAKTDKYPLGLNRKYTPLVV